MPNKLTTAQLQQAATTFLSSGQPSDVNRFYQYMSSQGYGYASLAGGLVTCSTVSGNIALNYMKQAAASQGESLTDSQINSIELGMARGYISTLIGNASASGSTSVDISFQQASTFHSEVFQANGLSPAAWTLYAPSQTLGVNTMQSLWAQIISPDSLTSNAGSALLYGAMGAEAGNVGMEELGTPASNPAARAWYDAVAGAGLTSIFGTPGQSCLSETKTISDTSGKSITVALGSGSSTTPATYSQSIIGNKDLISGAGASLSTPNEIYSLSNNSTTSLSGSGLTINMGKGVKLNDTSGGNTTINMTGGADTATVAGTGLKIDTQTARSSCASIARRRSSATARSSSNPQAMTTCN